MAEPNLTGGGGTVGGGGRSNQGRPRTSSGSSGLGLTFDTTGIRDFTREMKKASDAVEKLFAPFKTIDKTKRKMDEFFAGVKTNLTQIKDLADDVSFDFSGGGAVGGYRNHQAEIDRMNQDRERLKGYSGQPIIRPGSSPAPPPPPPPPVPGGGGEQRPGLAQRLWDNRALTYGGGAVLGLGGIVSTMRPGTTALDTASNLYARQGGFNAQTAENLRRQLPLIPGTYGREDSAAAAMTLQAAGVGQRDAISTQRGAGQLAQLIPGATAQQGAQISAGLYSAPVSNQLLGRGILTSPGGRERPAPEILQEIVTSMFPSGTVTAQNLEVLRDPGSPQRQRLAQLAGGDEAAAFAIEQTQLQINAAGGGPATRESALPTTRTPKQRLLAGMDDTLEERSRQLGETGLSATEEMAEAFRDTTKGVIGAEEAAIRLAGEADIAAKALGGLGGVVSGLGSAMGVLTTSVNTLINFMILRSVRSGRAAPTGGGRGPRGGPGGGRGPGGRPTPLGGPGGRPDMGASPRGRPGVGGAGGKFLGPAGTVLTAWELHKEGNRRTENVGKYGAGSLLPWWTDPEEKAAENQRDEARGGYGWLARNTGGLGRDIADISKYGWNWSSGPKGPSSRVGGVGLQPEGDMGDPIPPGPPSSLRGTAGSIVTAISGAVGGGPLRGNSMSAIQGMNFDFLVRLRRMFSDNPRLTLTSGVRNSAKQLELYKRYLAGKGPPAARPGMSKHEKGTAADIGPRSEYGWLAANAPKYGLRKPMSYEPWHWEPSSVVGGNTVAGENSAAPGGAGKTSGTVSKGFGKAGSSLTPLTAGLMQGMEEAMPGVTDLEGGSKVGGRVGELTDLNASQTDIVRKIVEVGKTMGVTPRYMLAAVEAGWMESKLQNLNSGHWDSIGVFQQRDHYGTREERLDVANATRMFFDEARRYDKGQPTAALLAADTQRPAARYRHKYQDFRDEAVTSLASVGYDASDVGDPLPPGDMAGGGVQPIPSSGYRSSVMLPTFGGGGVSSGGGGTVIQNMTVRVELARGSVEEAERFGRYFVELVSDRTRLEQIARG